jgi:hypothetical protein
MVYVSITVAIIVAGVACYIAYTVGKKAGELSALKKGADTIGGYLP